MAALFSLWALGGTDLLLPCLGAPGTDAWAAAACLALAADASSRAWNDWGADDSKWEDVSLPPSESTGTARAKKRNPSGGGWDDDW